MIKLYTFGPYFGLPDGSPFVTKALLLLRIAGLEFVEDRRGYHRAPKGKLPFVEDDGETVADSTFIRFHIEQKYGFDFDRGLSPAEKGVAWAMEKMCEEHLYWALIVTRWLDEANFAVGPRHFFDTLPGPVGAAVSRLACRKVRRDARAQGLGRHQPAELARLAIRDLESISALLGERPFLMGDLPRGVDATVGAFVCHTMAPTFQTPIRTAAEAMPNLVAYRKRVFDTWFPDLAARAAAGA